MEIERGLVKTPYGYIHYRAAGAGEAIVLLHINQQSSAVMLELMEALSPGLRAIAIDYPSHGHSDHLREQPSIGDYARCVAHVLDALGYAHAHVLGEATGAAVCIEFASSFPQRVDKVILVNCPLYLGRSIAESRHAPLKEGLRPSDESGFPTTRTVQFMIERDPGHAPMQPSQSWMDRINVAQLEAGRDRWQALDALFAYDIAANLSRVKAPVMMLVGEHFYYLRYRDDFAQRIADFRSEVLPGARFCMTWERAAEIGAKTLAFVRCS